MNDTWHIALHKITESHGSVIYQKTLLQKQQMKACFLSPRKVYNELNIEKIDSVSTLILTNSQGKQTISNFHVFSLDFSVWLHHYITQSCLSPCLGQLSLLSHPLQRTLLFLKDFTFYPDCLHLIYIFSSSFKGLLRLWLHLLSSGHFLLWSWVFIGTEMLCLLALSPHLHCQEMRANHSHPEDFMG